MKPRFLAIIAALALVALGAFAISATGSSSVKAALADRAFTISFEKSSNGEVDNKPKGPSVGDTWQGAGNIKQAGVRVGRMQVSATLLDAKYHSGIQTVVLLLADGSIVCQGTGVGKKIPGVPMSVKDNVFAITGGTGAYEGAGGSITLKPIGAGHTNVSATLHFSG